MIVLIDYDNLDQRTRRRGVRHVMTSLLQAIGRRRLAAERTQAVACRLYGGWFDGASLSPAAQELAADLRREFPGTVTVADEHGAHTVRIRADLALALACDPKVALTHTYRRRSSPPRLRCAAAPFPDCADPSRCPVASVHPFVRDGACPAEDCDVTPRAVLERAEQKLVDSMIVVDLVYLAEAASEPLVVVSADDDLWPGLRFVLLRGTPVVHVVPRRRRRAPGPYHRLETPAYSQVAMQAGDT